METRSAEGQVRTEVDLRGLRVGRAARRPSVAALSFMRSIDKTTIRARRSFPISLELRIIAWSVGKGTGAVRARVTALLEDDGSRHFVSWPPVGKRFRVELGRAESGGAGVTVASFRMIPDDQVEEVRPPVPTSDLRRYRIVQVIGRRSTRREWVVGSSEERSGRGWHFHGL